ncbi:aquaporin [Cryptosporangium phraense]|uniref:Aquaporin family protein n=1 Tax=Cryptosporangium phraense TaxID=2593070 RepID=A0A545AVH7_9ACTN|nr:aquaporin [Cryptosporangium phraense]TQS45337.1 hypothetical protein FL583_09625 [Cryptosporangium phraense]
MSGVKTSASVRPVAAEFVGSAVLAAVVVGSGIAATQLSTDVGMQLSENAAATAAGLFALILMFDHPAITIGRTLSDTFAGIAPGSVLPFVVAQVVGGLIVGVGLVWLLYPTLTAADASDAVVPTINDPRQPDRAPASN